MIPLPCTCLNNVRNGETTVYMLYVVRKGESLRSIAMGWGSTVSELEIVNGVAQDVMEAADILALPIAGWYYYRVLHPAFWPQLTLH